VQRTLAFTAWVHLDRGRVGVQFVQWDGLKTPGAPALRALSLPRAGAPELVVELDRVDNPR